MEKFQKQLQVGGWVLVAVFALSAVWLFQNISQMGRPENIVNTFSVNGTGKITASPDIAVADIAINVEAATSVAAQDEANKKSKTVVQYLENAGIKTTDIKTSGYSIYPQYDYSAGRTRIRGYQVMQSLTVKIRDLDKTNTIIDGVVDAGANQVSSVRFEIDDLDQLKAEAREEAIAEAQAKADELADQLDIKIGGIVSFYESNDQYPPMYGYGMGGGADMVKVQSNPAPELPAGQNEVMVSVTITYQIQ